MAYRTVTQATCPHDAKVKMAGFKDKYECTRCQKIIQHEEQSEKRVDVDNLEISLEQGIKSSRGSLPKQGFFDNLAKKAEEIRCQGIKLGKIAAREAEEIGDKIDDVVDDGWDAAKKFKPKSSESKNEIIDLLERLAKLKEQGIITEKEFNAKKKDLLNKI